MYFRYNFQVTKLRFSGIEGSTEMHHLKNRIEFLNGHISDKNRMYCGQNIIAISSDKPITGLVVAILPLF